MTATVLYLRKDDFRVADYCEAVLSATGTADVLRRKSIGFDIVEVRSESAYITREAANAVSDAITTFYKFKVLKNLDTGVLKGSLAHYALVGALLSVDIDDERKQVCNTLRHLTCVAPESLLELRLPSLVESWKGLKTLTEILLKQSREKEDLYELISYFISEGTHSPKLVITEQDPPGIEVDGKSITIPSLTGERETDLLLSVVRARPGNIIIRKKEALSPGLLDAIRGLGES